MYIPWYYQNVIIKPYHNFPEPVAKKLRRAIFYSKGKQIDIKEANKYFRQALQIANDMGMDPFSPEILGVKYAISQLFEQAGHYPLACEVLEIMRVDCRRWMDEFSDKHWNDGDRSRVLKVIVQLNVKLGELYTSKYMNQPEDAGKRLEEALETALKEKSRREQEGVKQGEGDWMTDEELGATMEGTLSDLLVVYSCATNPPCASANSPQLWGATTNSSIIIISQRLFSSKHWHLFRRDLATALY